MVMRHIELGPDGARLNIRNALFFCWTALPEPRRTPAEAERIVRLVAGRNVRRGNTPRLKSKF